eukprot:scaffold18.g2048.t1
MARAALVCLLAIALWGSASANDDLTNAAQRVADLNRILVGQRQNRDVTNSVELASLYDQMQSGVQNISQAILLTSTDPAKATAQAVDAAIAITKAAKVAATVAKDAALLQQLSDFLAKLGKTVPAEFAAAAQAIATRGAYVAAVASDAPKADTAALDAAAKAAASKAEAAKSSAISSGNPGKKGSSAHETEDLVMEASLAPAPALGLTKDRAPAPAPWAPANAPSPAPTTAPATASKTAAAASAAGATKPGAVLLAVLAVLALAL